MILVLIAIAPIVGERIRGLEVGRADRFRMAGAQMLDLARHAADVQVQMLKSVRSTMNAVAVTQALPAESQAAACGRAITRIAGTNEFIDVLSIASADGRMLCSNRPQRIGLQIGDRPYFKRALADGGFTISDIFIGRQVNRPIIAAALPKVGADGAAEFVVIATLNLAWFETATAKLLDRPNTSAFIVDGAGHVIARYPSKEGLVGRSFANFGLVRDVLSGTTGGFSAVDFDGVLRRFAAVRLDGTSAYFGAGVDENEILKNINKQITIAYRVIAGAIVMVLLAAWFGGERVIMRPMRALIGKAVRFGNGDYAAVASPTKIPSDFAPLDHALDRMAEQLASRERTLKEQNRHLDHLAQVDVLTGLPNRRSFDATLQAEWSRNKSTGQVVSLLMMDIDHFKRFNDHYGHVQGDACLRTIAKCVSQVTLRPSDLTARYGGEEFVTVLPSVTLDQAVAIAERVRQAVFDLDLPHRGAPTGRVTISIGAAALATQSASPQELIEEADAALYAAKRSGRNSVSVMETRLAVAAG